jgi:tRNA G18 (ribose-2'-O)-methylase SpoU
MKKLTLSQLGRSSVDEFKRKPKIPLVIILENIRSALNIGSVFRTCDAFAVERIVLTGISAQPPHKDILKSALGATDSVIWSYFVETISAIQSLKSDGYDVYAVEQTDGGTMLHQFIPGDKKIALVFGNEVDGVAQSTIEHCINCLELPQFGTKHSLNISVCAGIFIYDLFWKMNGAGGS